VTIRDLVVISIGEILLATTFVAGVLIGLALTRKDSQ